MNQEKFSLKGKINFRFNYPDGERILNKKPKLELTWIGKENRPRLEPRILLEDPEKSYHAKYRVKKKFSTDYTDEHRLKEEGTKNNPRKSVQSVDKSSFDIGDIFDNRLIFGDNLLALKALEQEVCRED
jgi:adenine-specific DNA-methyltransferase